MQVAIRIQLRRDTAANWVSANPVLRPGEIGIETDTLKFKIGNGSTWTATTSYANVTPSGLTNSLGDYILVADQGTPGGPAELDSNGDLIIPENSIVLWNDDAHTYTTTLTAAEPTANRTITIPNNSGTIALTSDISTAVSNLVDGAPGLLDTLNELAAAVNDDPTFFTTVATNLSNHEADTTNVHGIANTAKLVTDDGAQTLTNKTLTSPSITTPTGIVKADVGLGNVDNTSDANKPVSTATQAALDLKANSADITELSQDAVNTAIVAGNGITKVYDDNANTITLSVTDAVISEAAQDAVNDALIAGVALTKTYNDSSNILTIDLDNTAVTAGSYGSTTKIPTFTVDAQGRLTAASEADVATNLSIAGDTGTDTVNLLTDALTVAGGEGIDVAVTNNTVTVSAEDATSTNKGVASFNATDFTVTSGAVTLNQERVEDIAANLIVGRTGLNESYSDETNTLFLDIDSTVITDSGIQTLTNKTLTSPIINTPTGIVKADVGLANVDNTSDANKPVSTATQTALDGKLSLSGGDMTGEIRMGNFKVTGLKSPSNPTDATTKEYVDALTEGLHVHASANAYVATNIDIATALEAGDTIDGVTLTEGMRVLVNGQTTQSQNGIYVIQASGGPLRASDFDTAAEVDSGDFIFVSSGNTYANTGWVQTLKPATIGTDSISFTQFSGAGTFLAGNGLNLVGNSFSINTSTTADLTTAQTLTNKTLTSPVINTPTGITKSDVGLANVDNTSDAAKPISTATQTALDLKLASATAATTYAPIANPTFTGTVSGITKSMVGLDNVDNTSDANKPVSTATSTALGLKANLASPTFTGTVILPNNTVTNAMLAGSIANNKLTNSSIIMSIGTSDTTVALGGTYQIPSATPDLPGLVYGLVDSFNNNTGVGEFVLGGLTSGANNSALGIDALSSVQSGSDNVAIGANSLSQLLSGNQNVTIGTSAGATITTGSNNIIIGYNAATTAVNTNNQIVLGNSSITSLRIPGLGLDVNSSNRIVTETNTTTLTNKTLNNVIVNGVDFGNTPISVAAPIDDEHAVNKAYLANQIASSVGSDIFPLDDISVFFDGSTSRFQLTYDGDVFIPQNPYKLLITINGILQILGNQEKHWLSLIPSDGYFFDNDGFVQFGEPVPVGSKFEARYMSGPESQTAQKSIYPFRAVDIQLGD